MPSVVFLRAVNVGGSRSFKPSQLPDQLPTLEMTNIGAAGTYVLGAEIAPEDAREAILGELPFETEVMVRPGEEILDLLGRAPFGAAGARDGVKRYLSVLSGEPTAEAVLPLGKPEGDDWQLQVVGREPGYAFSLRRPDQPGRYYPNEVVEVALGVPATTRGWSTVERIGRVLTEG